LAQGPEFGPPFHRSPGGPLPALAGLCAREGAGPACTAVGCTCIMQNCTAVDDALRERLGVEQPAFVAQLLPQLMDLVRASRRLPVGEEHAIRRGSKEFLSASRDLGQRSMSAMNRTMRWLDPDMTSGADELVSFNLVEDSIDTVLERVDSCLRDALAGLSRSSEAMAEPELVPNGESSAGGASSMAKPQVRWRELIDNDRTEFVPRLMVKHNLKVPLTPAYLEAQCRAGFRAAAPGQQASGDAGAKTAVGSTASATAENSALLTHLSALGVARKEAAPLCNPYEEELRSLSFDDGLFETGKPEYFRKMEDTPLVYVSTARELRQLINEVKATCVGKEIAVDVEHHDLRSYRGFVCLVQLSTRQKDFLIDPFDIFEQMHWLNEIFTDPNILKVLHGSDRDVMWLQRDFSVYLVNMFDTGLATRALRLQGGFSLANLVSHYCGVKLDKKYQTADWRQRPLSEEMAHYARCDTHYLLYCFDCLRNTLLANGPHKLDEIPQATVEGIQEMRGVLDRTAALCLTQYSETPFDAPNAAMKLCERFGSKQKPIELRQFGCLKALVAWRDALGRRTDESTNFIAPDACLWRVALALPSTAARLRSACNPLPQLLQLHAAEVVDAVAKGTAEAASGVVPDSPYCSPSKPERTMSAPAALGSDAAAASSPTLPLLPPPACGLGTSSASSPVASHKAWPPTSCRGASPIVRVSSGSLRHASTGDGNSLCRSASLNSMFESETSEDEEIDPELLKNFVPLAQVFSSAFSAPAAVHASPAVTSVMAQAPTAAAGPPVKDEEAAPQSMRDAYQLPNAVRRKKKKKKKVVVPGLSVAAPAASGGVDSLEAEAASFRSALAAAFQTQPALSAQMPPRPTKRPLPAEVPEESDPYAAPGDPYAAAPAGSVAAPGAPAAAIGVPGAAASGPPRKKKKKIIRHGVPPQQPQASLVVDPYL